MHTANRSVLMCWERVGAGSEGAGEVAVTGTLSCLVCVPSCFLMSLVSALCANDKRKQSFLFADNEKGSLLGKGR